MRNSSSRARRKTLPRFHPVVVAVGIMVVMALFSLGNFSEYQPNIQAGEQNANVVKQVDAGSGHLNIVDHGYRELAVSFMMKSIYARPLEIPDIDKTAGILAADLGLDEKKLIHELKAERSFFWLGRKLSEGRADAILKRMLPGVYAVEETQRFYPARRRGAHVVGFIEENSGLDGVEFYYDHLLRRGIGGKDVESQTPGGHLQLTLDLRIQKILEDQLGALQRETAAPSGAGILMNMKTGAILAMVSFPDYDPNSYWDSSSHGRRNRAVNGSVDIGGFKYVFGRGGVYEEAQNANMGQLAALKLELLLDSLPKKKPGNKWFEQFDENLLSPELRIWKEDGQVAGGEPAPFEEKIGLFRKTGIDLPENNDINPSQIGQTTPLKLLTAFVPLVNGGIGVTPHLAEAVIDPSSGERTIIEYPVKPDLVTALTSRKVVEALQDASRSGGGAIFLESMRVAPVGPGEDDGGDENLDGNQKICYQAVMIGFTPNQEEGIALLIALDQAAVANNNKTVLRSSGEAMISQVLGLAGEKVKPPSLEAMQKRERSIYEKWLDSQVVEKKDNKTATVRKEAGLMPDLRGLSLRKALRNMQQFDLKVRVAGSGRVVAQQPRAGLIVSGDECLLTLKVDTQ